MRLQLVPEPAPRVLNCNLMEQPLLFGDYGWQSNELVSGVRARTIYFRYTGQRMHDAAIVHTGIAALQRINSTQQYSVTPGLLGEVLKDAGVKVSIYGNSDQPRTSGTQCGGR